MGNNNLNRKPFSEINDYVYPKLSNPELFDCGSFNLLKVVQHGLVYYYINDRSKLLKPYWHLPQWIIKLILLLKRFKYKASIRKQKLKYNSLKVSQCLTLDINRPITGTNLPDESYGMLDSKFMHHIFNVLGRNNCFNIVSTRPGEKVNVSYDLVYDEINLFGESLPPDDKEISLLKNLKKTWDNINRSGKFLNEELKFIKCQFHWFWLNYKVYSAVVKKVQPKSCLLIPHYHREPIIAALKENQIEVSELQHASILEDAIYYLYPEYVKPVAQKALFADQILVWGGFWKERLLKGGEYDQDQIQIIGNYIYSQEVDNNDMIKFKNDHQLEGKKVVLITSQKKLTEYFARYINFLAEDLRKNHPNWMIILKPHPGEDMMELYNMEFKNYILTSKGVPINLLFQLSDVHVSIYSTTLYDAQAFSLTNFAITDAGISSDYALKMIKEGIAHPLKMNENPVDKIPENGIKSSLSKNRYFEDFAPEVITDKFQPEAL